MLTGRLILSLSLSLYIVLHLCLPLSIMSLSFFPSLRRPSQCTFSLPRLHVGSGEGTALCLISSNRPSSALEKLLSHAELPTYQNYYFIYRPNTRTLLRDDAVKRANNQFLTSPGDHFFPLFKVFLGWPGGKDGDSRM